MPPAPGSLGALSCANLGQSCLLGSPPEPGRSKPWSPTWHQAQQTSDNTRSDVSCWEPPGVSTQSETPALHGPLSNVPRAAGSSLQRPDGGEHLALSPPRLILKDGKNWNPIKMHCWPQFSLPGKDVNWLSSQEEVCCRLQLWVLGAHSQGLHAPHI